jgi:hypothetical protein
MLLHVLTYAIYNAIPYVPVPAACGPSTREGSMNERERVGGRESWTGPTFSIVKKML